MSQATPPWHCTLCAQTLTTLDIGSHIASVVHQERFYRDQGTLRYWPCDLCLNKVDDATLQDIDVHLSSEEHINKSAELPGLYAPFQPPQPTTSPSPPPDGECWCEPCQRSMQAVQEFVHLRGKSHRMKVETLSRFATMQATSSEPQIPTSAPTSTPAPSPAVGVDHGAWTCEICDRTMQLAQKVIHENANDHLRRLKNGTGNQNWYCNVCNRDMQASQKDIHLNGNEHLRRQRLQAGGLNWTCDICAREMQATQRDIHLSSAGHAKAVKKKRWQEMAAGSAGVAVS